MWAKPSRNSESATADANSVVHTGSTAVRPRSCAGSGRAGPAPRGRSVDLGRARRMTMGVAARDDARVRAVGVLVGRRPTGTLGAKRRRLLAGDSCCVSCGPRRFVRPAQTWRAQNRGPRPRAPPQRTTPSAESGDTTDDALLSAESADTTVRNGERPTARKVYHSEQAHLPAEQPPARQDPRLPVAHADPGRSLGPVRAPGQGTRPPVGVDRQAWLCCRPTGVCDGATSSLPRSEPGVGSVAAVWSCTSP